MCHRGPARADSVPAAVLSRGAGRARRLGSFFAVTPTRGPGVGACGYALAFSKSSRYFPYPSASSLATGMKRSEAELMQ